MAKGAQDWVDRTDVLFQTLSELITRNKLGSLQIAEPYPYPYEKDLYTITVVSGKGVVYGGHYHTVRIANYIKLIIDDQEEMYTPELESLYRMQRINPEIGLEYLVQYDLVTPLFTVGIMPGITFESSLKIKINHTVTEPMVYTILYAVI